MNLRPGVLEDNNWNDSGDHYDNYCNDDNDDYDDDDDDDGDDDNNNNYDIVVFPRRLTPSKYNNNNGIFFR